MTIEEFAKARFTESEDSQRAQLCADLGRVLVSELAVASDFHGAVRQAVEKLRDLGHDLWSIDESDDFEVWGPNYQSPTGPGILITFSTEDGVEVQWIRE